MKGQACELAVAMEAHVRTLDGQTFVVDVGEEESVIDILGKIRDKQNYQVNVRELKLILGSVVLDDSATLSNTTAKDGDVLTLIKKLGIRELIVESIFDDTQLHSKHKFALRSEPLIDEVEKIEVTVEDFQDQGWGGCQARLFLYLHDSADTEVARMKLFGPLRTAEYDEAKHKRSPSCFIGQEEPVVALAKPGMMYKLRYQCGGGGGHSITVKNWRCQIFPMRRSTDEVTAAVSSHVDLRNTSRLGPDKVTGEYELIEPPYHGPMSSDVAIS